MQVGAEKRYNYQVDAPISFCPACRQPVNPDFYFCPNCGKKLRSKPLSTSIWTQAWIYFVSVLLPPLGLWPAVKYVRSDDKKARTIGIVAILLTVIGIIIAVWYTIGFINQLNQSINSLGF